MRQGAAPRFTLSSRRDAPLLNFLLARRTFRRFGRVARGLLFCQHALACLTFGDGGKFLLCGFLLGHLPLCLRNGREDGFFFCRRPSAHVCRRRRIGLALFDGSQISRKLLAQRRSLRLGLRCVNLYFVGILALWHVRPFGGRCAGRTDLLFE